jgi:hypothetical protein
MNTHFSDDYREIIETTHVKKRLNDLTGLTAIAKFGWLRAREIGNVLWPHNESRNVAGARIVRRWVQEAGYLGATSTRRGGNGPSTDPFDWGRLNVRVSTSGFRLLRQLLGMRKFL